MLLPPVLIHPDIGGHPAFLAMDRATPVDRVLCRGSVIIPEMVGWRKMSWLAPWRSRYHPSSSSRRRIRLLLVSNATCIYTHEQTVASRTGLPDCGSIGWASWRSGLVRHEHGGRRFATPDTTAWGTGPYYVRCVRDSRGVWCVVVAATRADRAEGRRRRLLLLRHRPLRAGQHHRRRARRYGVPLSARRLRGPPAWSRATAAGPS